MPTQQAGIPRFTFVHDSEATIGQNDLRLARKVQTELLAHSLLFGLDARRYRLDDSQSFAFGTSLDPTDPDYGIVQPEVDDPSIDGVRVQGKIGLCAQDQMRFRRGLDRGAERAIRQGLIALRHRIGDDLDRNDGALPGAALARQTVTSRPMQRRVGVKW